MKKPIVMDRDVCRLKRHAGTGVMPEWIGTKTMLPPNATPDDLDHERNDSK
jgi:hypothetical protein